MSFEPHGDYELQRCGQVVIVRPIGSWNHERMESFSLMLLNEFMPPLLEKPWASLTDIRRWEFTLPDAFDIVKQNQEWAWANGMIRQAIIISDVMQKELYDIRGGMMNHENTRYFENEEDAWEWFTGEGFPKINCEPVLSSFDEEQ